MNTIKSFFSTWEEYANIFKNGKKEIKQYVRDEISTIFHLYEISEKDFLECKDYFEKYKYAELYYNPNTDNPVILKRNKIIENNIRELNNSKIEFKIKTFK